MHNIRLTFGFDSHFCPQRLLAFCLCLALARNVPFALEGVWVWVTAQECIHIFNAAEIATYGNILYRAFMLIGLFGFIPGAFILLPRNHALWCRQINIHVCPIEFSD